MKNISESNAIFRLELALFNLMNSLVGMPKYMEIKNKVLSINRKLRITRELADTRYIAIAGTQSAGKTRLIREMYDLDNQWISDNEGRGEQLPLFIIEHEECTQPYAVVVEYTNDREQEREITSEELHTILRNYNAENSILLAKLYVPIKYFKQNNFGFVLLPGYEMETRENQKWQQLMRHTLTHALGCILVTDETRIAENTQKRILDDLRSQYLENRQPIVAVTKTENLKDEQRVELRQTVAEAFEFSEQQKANIVLTGADDDNYKKNWSSALMYAIMTTTLNSKQSEAAKYAELDYLLSDEVDDIISLSQIGLLEVDSIGTNSQAEKNINEILEKFDTARDKFKRKYNKELTRQTHSYVHATIALTEEAYTDNEEGIKNWWNNLGEDHQRRAKQRIQSMWRDNQNTKKSEPKTIIESNVKALSDLSNDQLGLNVTSEFTRNEQGLINNTAALLGENKSNKVAVLDKPEVQDGIKRLFSPSVISTDNDIKFNNDLSKAIALVPALVMEYGRLMQVAVVTTPDFKISEKMSGDKLIENFATTVSTGLPKFNESLKPIITTMATILAVDVTIDGQIDTIPALIQAVSSTATISAGGVAAGIGATASMAAAGVIVGGYLVYQAHKEVQRYHATQKEYIATVIEYYGDMNIQNSLDQYDDVMENIRDVLSDNLRKAYGLDQKLGKSDTVLRCLTATKNAQENLQRYLGGQQSRLA
mgnify:FL=1